MVTWSTLGAVTAPITGSDGHHPHTMGGAAEG